MLELRQDQVDPNHWLVIEHTERGERVVAHCVEWSYRDGLQINGSYEPLEREINMRFRMIYGCDFTAPRRSLPEPPVTAELITKRLRNDGNPLLLPHEKE